jgi:hypothetical protein
MKDVGGEGSTPERSDPKAMVQQGQTFELRRRGTSGERLWAYRYRAGGRDSKRVQHGGFASEQDARDALERELERLRRERRITRRLTLSELVDTYLDQHDVQPVTIEKLRYLLSKATVAFGDRFVGELTSQPEPAGQLCARIGKPVPNMRSSSITKPYSNRVGPASRSQRVSDKMRLVW